MEVEDKTRIAGSDISINAPPPSKGKNNRKINKFLLVVALLVLIGVLALILGVALSQRGGKAEDEEDAPRLEQYRYSSAAVAADHQTCSTIGKNILKGGGSAADAGIAAMLCVGVVNCHSAGIGGGHFSAFYDRATQSVTSVNAREKAPLAATQDMYVGSEDASKLGGLAIGVPGDVEGYFQLHQRAGRLPWRDLFAPSIKLAQDGFPIGGALFIAMDRNRDLILNDNSLSEIFTDGNGNLLQEGDIIRLPKLAVTWDTIANNGSSAAFYQGELAATIAAEITARGGIITTEDLDSYKVEVESPLMIKLDDFTVYLPKLPSGGPVLAYILNILDGYDFSSESISNSSIGLTYHRFAEACKFGFARRAGLGDDEFEDVESLVDYLVSEEAAEETRGQITDDRTHEPEYYSDIEFSFTEDSGTSHVSVIDADGNALAMTGSINFYFGSKVRGNITGIFYNNELDDFSTPNTINDFGVPASPINFPKPGKRPLSSMVPIIIVDDNGDVRLVSGAAGGTTITSSTAMVAMHSLWFGDDVRQASRRKRIHHQLYPPYVRYEEGIQNEIITGLTDRGHDVEARQSIGVSQLVTQEDGYVYAISDARKAGHGAGGY